MTLRIGDRVAAQYSSYSDYVREAEVLELNVIGSNPGRHDHVRIRWVNEDYEAKIHARAITKLWHQYEIELENQRLQTEWRSEMAARRKRAEELNQAFLRTLIPEAESMSETYSYNRSTIYFTRESLWKFLNRMNEERGADKIAFQFPTELQETSFQDWLDEKNEEKIRAKFPDTKEVEQPKKELSA